MIDDKTPARAYPLPHQANELDEDLPRLRQALGLIDADVGAVQAGLAAEQAARLGLAEGVAALENQTASLGGGQAALDTLVRSSGIRRAVVGGSADALVVTCSPPVTALDQPVLIGLVVAAANTGAVTVAVDGLGARPLLWGDGTPLARGELTPGLLLVIAGDGAGWRIPGRRASAALGGDSALQSMMYV